MWVLRHAHQNNHNEGLAVPLRGVASCLNQGLPVLIFIHGHLQWQTIDGGLSLRRRCEDNMPELCKTMNTLHAVFPCAQCSSH